MADKKNTAEEAANRREQARAAALRVLEMGKDKCAQAVLEGCMTATEYEQLTGRSGEDVLARVEGTVRQRIADAVGKAAAELEKVMTEAHATLAGVGLSTARIEEILKSAPVTLGGMNSVVGLSEIPRDMDLGDMAETLAGAIAIAAQHVATPAPIQEVVVSCSNGQTAGAGAGEIQDAEFEDIPDTAGEGAET